MATPADNTGTTRTGSTVSVVPLRRDARHRRCGCCAVQERCLSAGLGAAESARFADEVQRRRTLVAGEHLYRVGDPFHGLYVIRSGAFKSFAVDAEGREHVTNFNFAGEILGIDAIYPESHVSNAVALVESSICCLPFRAMSELARDIPALQTRILRLVSREVFGMTGMAGDFTAEERLAAFLVMVAARQTLPGDDDPTHLQLPMCRQDIANYLRLAPETISRILARFQRSGLVRADRRTIELRDPAGLREIAACMNPYARCHPYGVPGRNAS